MTNHQAIFAKILSAFAVTGLAGCSTINTLDTSWNPQELAIMAMVRCLYTGGHMNRNEATRFVAQINAEQSGQFQRVYDTLHTGASAGDNSKIETIIKQQGGCRKVMTDFVNSDPETDFKKSIQMDWALKPIKYFDE